MIDLPNFQLREGAVGYSIDKRPFMGREVAVKPPHVLPEDLHKRNLIARGATCKVLLQKRSELLKGPDTDWIKRFILFQDKRHGTLRWL